MRIVVLGLSITSSWGNGHATTFRSLVKGLAGRGHEVLFLERDVPWYAANRDLPEPPFGQTCLYPDTAVLRERYTRAVRGADLVVLGSYVPDGREVAAWLFETANGVLAFYDIDTPVTLKGLEAGGCGYLARQQVPRFDLYLSFTGGPILARLERDLGARRARPLYCSVDPDLYYPEPTAAQFDLGYLGTYSDDRQPKLEALLFEPARRWPRGRFIVAGPQYPDTIRWPGNVARTPHLAPDRHRGFYAAQRFTLNVTRADMVAAGHAPSVRLFEAAACAVPVLSDRWPGLEDLFRPDEEILIVDDGGMVLRHLLELPEARRRAIGAAARARVLGAHTGERRAVELERLVAEVTAQRSTNPSAAERRAS